MEYGWFDFGLENERMVLLLGSRDQNRIEFSGISLWSKGLKRDLRHQRDRMK